MKKSPHATSTLHMTSNGLQARHPWQFKRYFKASAFGWRGTQLATKRIKEALKEINQTKKTSTLLAAEGAIYMMSRFWPAFQHIDTSSGSLGGAVNHAIEKLLPIIIQAPANLDMRQHWLKILWQVLQDDGVDYVGILPEYWGELSAFPEEASRQADEFIWIVKYEWERKNYIVHYDVACLSALFYAKRYEDILSLIELAPYPSWWQRKFGAQVLALTAPEKAISYAEDTRHIINTNQLSIDQFCESVLLNAGELEDAYQRYAIFANRANTYLSWFNKIKKKYSSIKSDEQILLDLINQQVVEPGKWFATANKIKCYDLALKLIQDSPADPKTLNRAAQAQLDTNPNYALNVAWMALHWMTQGYGYEITGLDLHSSLSIIEQSAKTTQKWDTIKLKLHEIAKQDAQGFYSELILRHLRNT